MLRLVGRVIAAVVGLVLLLAASFAVYVGVGWRSEAHLDGTLQGLPVRAAVTVVRDERDVPHVRASSVHDAMVAQGYLEGADRLFQIDLIRHYVYGRLAEWFGSAALPSDEYAREFDVRRVIDTEYARLSPQLRGEIDAFTDGINAAMWREPLPVEYRLLLLRPEPWRPQDSLAVGFATVLDLIDPWDDVAERDRIFKRFGAAGTSGLISITDPRYDAPTTAGPARAVPALPALPPRTASQLNSGTVEPHVKGSNEWVAGGAHTSDGHALLANDPHLTIRIPGVWYLVDLQAPGYHVAGASLAGTPGVILGHNDHVAWGATNGTVVCEVLYDADKALSLRREEFGVRFGAKVVRQYEADHHGFIVGGYSVDWPAVRDPASPIETFDRLGRARSIEEAVAALSNYPGPTQNFVLADDTGRAAYHLAGIVPADPFWGLRVHPIDDPLYPGIPFKLLPAVAPSRAAIAFTANNRMYGRDYPLRLSPYFSPPYRAARIEELLRARSTYDAAYFAGMQRDTLSLVERELAAMTIAAAKRAHYWNKDLAELAGWNGRFDGDSRGASIAARLRDATLRRFESGFFQSGPERSLFADSSDVVVVMMRALREHPKGYFARDDTDAFLLDALRSIPNDSIVDWRQTGSIPIRHPLATLGISWFNGVVLPGGGDNYSIHAQHRYEGQSFRAVWDVGNWDSGGIVIPSGESGRPGSEHYTDLSATWIAQQLVPLPFSERAVDAAARHRLTLEP